MHAAWGAYVALTIVLGPGTFLDLRAYAAPLYIGRAWLLAAKMTCALVIRFPVVALRRLTGRCVTCVGVSSGCVSNTNRSSSASCKVGLVCTFQPLPARTSWLMKEERFKITSD
jgi:hypothetical protein